MGFAAAHRQALGRLGFEDWPVAGEDLAQVLAARAVDEHYAAFFAARAAQDRLLPRYVREEFEAYLTCGRMEYGFPRLRCASCHAEKLVAFSCKRRGFCPSCGARRMADSAALLVEEVLPCKPMRQWVLSLPFALRFLLATNPQVLTQVLRIVYRTISGDLLCSSSGGRRRAGEAGVSAGGSAEQRSAAGASGTGSRRVKLPGLLATVNVTLAALHAAKLSGNVGVAVVAGVAA